MKHRELGVAILATMLVGMWGVLPVPTRAAYVGAASIAPAQAMTHGHTYAEWAAAWTQWALGIPAAENPITDETGEHIAVGQDGKVWFLAGNFGGVTVRTGTVPAGKALFFPVLNAFYFKTEPEEPTDPGDIRDLLLGYLGNLEGITFTCEIDGYAVPHLDGYFAESSLFELTVPEANLWSDYGLAAGAYAPAACLGYYLMVEPLSIGEHTLRFTGNVPGDPDDFTVDVTYHLTVQGGDPVPVTGMGTGSAAAADPQAAQVVPHGPDYAEWADAWTQWALGIPAAENPLTDDTGAYAGVGQVGNVWFLAGNFGGVTTRDCVVPADKSLFFPVLNAFYFKTEPEEPTDPGEIRDLLLGYLGNLQGISLGCEIDGEPVPGLEGYYTESALFALTVPEDNLWSGYGLAAGAYAPAACLGYYLMVEPLSIGEHTIRLTGNVPGDPDDFSVDVTYHLTVVSAAGCVLPPQRECFGTSPGEYAAAWMQWALGIPAAENPITDETGEHAAAGQHGDVWFLAGNFGGATERTCTVPAGKALYFPVLNSFYFKTEPEEPTDPADIRDLLLGYIGNREGISIACEIDGQAVHGLEAHYTESPLCEVTLPADNLWAGYGLAAGTYAPAATLGYYLMLAPLSTGEHTIRFSSTVPGDPDDFVVDVTYRLTVAHLPAPALPPRASAYGRSYGQWASAWTQWALGIPAAENPLTDETGAHAAVGQEGDVWFLAGNFGGVTVRECTVPVGKALFFPVLNSFYFKTEPEEPTDPAAIRDLLLGYVGNREGITFTCEIDGREVSDLEQYFTESPLFGLTLPSDNLWAGYGLGAGTYAPAATLGYYLLLSPLGVGEHVIRFTSRVPGEPEDFMVDVTYQLTVAGTPGGIAPAAGRAYGHSYPEWAESWTKWALGIPADQNPLSDETGEHLAVGQRGDVWFLAGNFGGTTVRTCSVPAEKALFFPILNSFYFKTEPEEPTDPGAIRDLLLSYVGNLEGITFTCEIDGQAVPDLEAYYTESPLFALRLPPDNLWSGWGLGAGTYMPAATLGYYLLVEPLDLGPHTIRFTGNVPGDPDDFTVDVTYQLTVQPPGSLAADLEELTVGWDPVPGIVYRLWWTDRPGEWHADHSIAIQSGSYTEPAARPNRQYCVTTDP